MLRATDAIPADVIQGAPSQHACAAVADNAREVQSDDDGSVLAECDSTESSKENLWPTKHQRQNAKTKILDAVNSWLAARIDEVFEMADDDDRSSIVPITWRDLKEVRQQICGCVGVDLDHDLGEVVQMLLEEEIPDVAEHRSA